MRILYVPLYTATDLSSCSTYLMMRRFFESWLSDGGNYLYFPTFTGFEIDHPQVTNIILDNGTYRSQRDRMKEVPEEIAKKFQELWGDDIIDVVVCDSPMIVPYLKGLLSSYTKQGSGGILFVNMVQFVFDHKSSSFAQDVGFMNTVLGMAVADLNVVSLPNDLNRLLQEARRYLSPVMVEAIKKNTIVSLGGVDVDRIRKFVSAEKDPEFTFNWGVAMNSGYNVEEIFNEFDMLFCSGRGIKVVASSANHKTTLFDFSKYSYFKLRDRVPQEEFWSICSRCHAFIFSPAGVSELSYSVIEQQLLGLLGLLKDDPQNIDMVYPGYPFLYKDHVDLIVKLRQVYQTYQSGEIKAVIARQEQYVTENFDLHKRNRTVVEKINILYDSMLSDSSIGSELVDIMRALPDDEYTYEEWGEAVKVGTVAGVNPTTHRSRFGATVGRYRRMMELAGFRDTCEYDKPVFRRIK